MTRPATTCLALLLVMISALASCGDAPSTPVPEPEEVDRASTSTTSEDTAPALEVDVLSWAKVAPEQIAEAKKHGVPVAFENDLGMRFVLIPAGTFLMGSPDEDPERDLDEFQHEATIDEPYYLQVTELTKGQYLRFDPWYQSPHERTFRRRPEWVDSEDQPACVGHIGGRHFAAWLTALDDRRDYRLPTETEWEYACRAGTKTLYWWGNDGELAGRYENLGQQRRLDPVDGFLWTAPVGHFPANPWGLHDMGGNVSEVCVDKYEAYPEADEDSEQRVRVIVKIRPGHVVRRGGGCNDRYVFARSAWRDTVYPDYEPRRSPIGFRLVSPLPERVR